VLPCQPLAGLNLVDSQYPLQFFDAVFNEEPLCLHLGQCFMSVLFQVGIGERIFYFNGIFSRLGFAKDQHPWF